jgi:hypothetical protein
MKLIKIKNIAIMAMACVLYENHQCHQQGLAITIYHKYGSAATINNSRLVFIAFLLKNRITNGSNNVNIKLITTTGNKLKLTIIA